MLFWTAVFDRSAYSGISVAVFFMTLDSCLTLWLRLRYTDMMRFILRTVLTIVAAVVSLITLAMYVVMEYRSDPSKPNGTFQP